MSKILVVDDLSSDRRIAGGLLAKDKSLEIIYAANGIEALRQIELHGPDLVLTDLQMPEMNGLELVHRIREDHPKIPAVIMTARGSEEFAVQALEQGAASYVPKKHLANQLLETVCRVLATSAEQYAFTRLRHCVSETKFVLENDLALLSALVSQLRQEVEERGICDHNAAIRVATGLDEALLNAYYHGNLEVDSVLKQDSFDAFYVLAAKRKCEHPFCDRRINVTARFSPNDATFVIRDDGHGFHPDDLPDPSDPQYLERPSGRGLLLMRSFVDEVIYNDVGNEVTLVKHNFQPAERRDRQFAV